MIEERLLGALENGRSDAEYELDLSGLDLPHARESIRQMLERSRFRAPRSIALKLDPPPEGGGETLFQPVGRQLLEARRSGILSTLTPLPPEFGIGYRIETTGKPDAEDEDPETEIDES